jgi:hypothetical protein
MRWLPQIERENLGQSIEDNATGHTNTSKKLNTTYKKWAVGHYRWQAMNNNE